MKVQTIMVENIVDDTKLKVMIFQYFVHDRDFNEIEHAMRGAYALFNTIVPGMPNDFIAEIDNPLYRTAVVRIYE